MLMLAGKKISQSTLACSVVKVPRRREAAPGCGRRGVAPDARTALPGVCSSCGRREARGLRSHVRRVRTTSCPRYSTTPSPQWREWWSRGDSNPLPPPCKGGALPGELRPLGHLSASLGALSAGSLVRRTVPRDRWWAILDSNQGPQSYQDCALTT